MSQFYALLNDVKEAIAKAIATVKTGMPPSRKRLEYAICPHTIHNELKPEFSKLNLSQMQTVTNNAAEKKSPAFLRFMSLVLMSLALMVSAAKAQIPVTVTGGATTPALSASYPTLADALNGLNAVTVMTGPVTLTLDAGVSETAPLTGFTVGSTSLNAVLSATNTVTIVKAAGAATVLTAATGGTATPTSAAPNGILKIVGADYVTIDGLTLTDGNAAIPAAMEFGLGIFKASATDGAQNNTVQNCIINVQRINNTSGTTPMVEGSVGILMINSIPTAATTVLTITAASGTNSNNKFYSNTINGGNYGMALIGFAGATPFTTCDQGTIVGASGLGNSILNFGGGAATNPSAGIRTLAQYGISVGYNTVNNNNGSGVNHATTLRGIYLNTATSASATITNNTVSIQGGGTTSTVNAIDNASGSTAASNTINITNNTVNIGYPTATSGVYNGIINSSSAAAVNINGNTIGQISGVALAGTGTHVMIEGGSPGGPLNTNNNTVANINRTGASGSWRGIKATTPTGSNLWTCSGNTVENLSWTAVASTGSIDGIYDLSSATNINITNNIVRNLSTPTTGTINGININTVTGTHSCTNNQIYNFTTTAGGAGGATFTGIVFSVGNATITGNQVYSLNSSGTTGGTGGSIQGIRQGGGTTNLIAKNKIYDLSSTSTNPTVIGINSSGGTTTTVQNNLVGDLRATAANAANPIRGIDIANTTTNLYFNTVYINGSSSGAVFGTSAVNTSTSTSLDMRNNILVNLSSFNTTGLTVAYRRASATLTSYANTSNNNFLYAGTPGVSNLIFYDGTNSDQTIGAFKTRVSPRDNSSVSEVVSSTPGVFFQSFTGANANFLHMVAGLTTLVESGASVIGSITDDYDGDTRNALKPDIGADEFAGLSPAPFVTFNSITPGGNQCTATAHTISVTATTPSGTSITGVTITYNNGTLNSNIPMTNTSGNIWEYSIPAASPVNTSVSWSVTATNSVPLSATLIGTPYSDEPLFGATGVATASVNPVCSGSPTALSAVITKPGNVALGAGASTSSTAGESMFAGAWGGAKTQYLIKASELAAAGLGAGNITALAFEATSSGQAYQGFNVKIAHTTLTVLTSPATTPMVSTGLSQVYLGTGTNNGFTPAVGVNSLTFGTGGTASSFNWNGTDNIIIEFCWSSDPIASTSTGSTVRGDNPGFVCTASGRSDNLLPSALCPLTNGFGTSTSGSFRPKFTFSGNSSVPITSVVWDNGAGTGNPVTVSPTSTTTYTAAITALGCTTGVGAAPASPTVTVTVIPLPTAPTAGTASTQCGTGVPTVSVSDPNAFTTPTFKWYADNVTTTALQSSTSATYTSTISTTTNFWVSVVNPTTGCESPRTQVTAVVTAPDPVAASSDGPVCANSNLQLTATVTSGANGNVYTYTWAASPATGSGIPTSTGGGTGTLGSPASTTITPTAAGTYVYTVTAVDNTLGCTTTANVSVNINPNPIVISATATPTPLCSGSTVSLSASSSSIPGGSVTLGAGGTNSTTSGESMFSGSWGGIKTQYLVRASELIAAGLTAGSNLTSLSFETASAAGQQYTGFAVSIGHTTQSTMSLPLISTGLTQVYAGTEGANNGYTPATSAVNTLGFGTGGSASSFTWNGTDNIVISFCFSTVTGATTSSTTSVKVDATGFTSSAYGKEDATLPSAFCPLVASVDFGTTGTASNRPKFSFGVINTSSNTWSWTTTLSGGTIANGATTTHVPTTAAVTTGTYTATATSAAGCTGSLTSGIVTVNPLPGNPINVTFPSVQCGTSTPDGTVTGAGGGQTYRWYLASAPTVALAGQTGPSLSGYPISVTTNFLVSIVDGTTGCESATLSVTANVVSPDAVSASASPSPVCANSSLTLTATVTGGVNNNTYSYSWDAAPNVPAGASGINGPTSGGTGGNFTTQPVTNTIVTPTTAGSYTYTVTATDAGAGCSTTSQVVVTVNPVPVIDSITANPSTVCAGSTASLNVYSAGGFLTGPSTPPSGYCTATFSSTTEDDIGQVTFAGINNPSVRPTPQLSNASAVETYTDYTGTPAGTVIAGNSYPITVYHFHGTANQSANFVNVYIDFNRNGVLTDAGEVFSLSKPGATFLEDFVGNISIPATASLGVTLMRVVVREGAITTPCNSIGTWGEAEDYLLDIQKVNPQNPSLTYAWSPTVTGSGASVTVTPASTDLYSVLVTNTSTTCSNTASVTVTVLPLPSEPVGTNSQQCGTGVPTASVVSGGVGGSGVYKWYLVPTGGTAIAGETGTSLVNYTISTPTSFYVSEVGTNGCESPRTQVDITFDLIPDDLTLSASPSPICLGQSFTFTVGQTGGANSFIFNYPSVSHDINSGINIPNIDGIDSSLLDPNITVTPTAAGTYTYTVRGFDPDKGCVSVATTSVVVNPLPTISTFTVTPSPICEGATLTLAATSIAIGNGNSASIGNGITATTSTQELTAFCNRRVTYQHQAIFTAAELQAAGLVAGNITAVTYNITSEGDASTTSNYTVKMGHTALSALTTSWVTGLTTVRNAATYTHAVGLNSITLDIPFNWDGVSNVIVDVTHGGIDDINNATTLFTAQATNMQSFGFNGAATATLTTSRLNVIFTGQTSVNNPGVTWTFNPGAIPGPGGVATTTASTVITSYTATAVALGCSKTSDPVSITVNPIPAAPSATPSTQCGDGVPTASVSGAGGTFKWYSASTNGTLLQTGGSTYTTSISAPTHFWVSETSAAGCEGPRADVFADVTAPPTLTITPGGPTTFCAGGTVSLTASGSGFTTFSWSPATGLDATNLATVNANPSTTQTYTVSASGAGCANTGTVTVTVNPNPVVDSVRANPTSICSGNSSTLNVYSAVLASGPAGLPGTYCVPLQSGGSLVSSVVFGTINNSVTQVTPFYDIYPASGSTTTTVTAGQTYNLAMTSSTASIASVWIDYNRNGLYDASEWQQVWVSASSGNINITIPLTAAAGQTGMRIRTRGTGSANASGDACTEFFSGSAQDYTINIIGITTQNPAFNYTWTPGSLTGFTTTVSPTTTTPYSVLVVNPATSCSTAVTDAVTVNVVPVNAAASASPAAICIGGSSTLSAAASTGGLPLTYAWRVQGNPTVIGSSVTLSVTPAATTVYELTVLDACGNPSVQTTTVTVNPLPTISINEPSISICEPNTYSLTSTTNAASPSYQWVKVPTDIGGANASSYTVTASGFYRVRVTDGVTGCVNTSGQVTVNVNPLPAAVVMTPTSATVCAGTPQSLNAVSSSSGGGSIGTGTATNTVSAPYKGFWGGHKAQYLYTASELTAIGFTTGSSITSLAMNISAFTSPYTFNNFTISMKNTAATVLTSTPEAGTNTVFGPINYTLTGTAPFTVSHTLTTPFAWDGSSNLLVEFCFNNNNGGGVSANSATVTSTTTATALTSYFSQDNSATVCTTASGWTTSTSRPNINLLFNSTSPITWSPATGLNTTSGNTVIATPATTTTYTATATTAAGCTQENTVELTVNPVTVITADAAPSAQLVGQNTTATPLTVTATGTGTVTYQWFSNTTNSNTGGTPVGTGSSYAPSTTAVGTLYYYAVASSDCGTATSSVVSVEVVNANSNFWTGNAGSNWSTPGSWSLNAVPSVLNDAIIPTGATPYPVLSAASNAKSLLIQSGATVSLNGQALTIVNEVDPTGTGTFIGSATSSLAVGATSTLRFAAGAGGVIKNLTINGGTATLATALDVTGGSGAINNGTNGIVTVANGATLASGGFLTLKSNASGTARVAQGATTGQWITGDVTVERYIPGNAQRAWRFLSVPTKGLQTIKQSWQEGATPANMNPKPGFGTMISTSLAPYSTLGFDERTSKASLQFFNQASGAWVDVNSTFSTGNVPKIESVKGYGIYIRGDRTQYASGAVTSTTPTTLRTTGTLYTGDQTAITIAANKFDLIGNTYVSPIDFLGLTRTNMVNSFYLWDPKLVTGTPPNQALGGYVTFSLTNGFVGVPNSSSYGITPRTTIQSGEAFMVQANAGGGSITLRESAKVQGDGINYFRPTAGYEKMKANLYTVNGATEVMADANVSVFDPAFANAVDGDDALKLPNAGENFAIRREASTLVVEGRQVTTSYDTTAFWMWNLRQGVQYKLELVAENMNVTGRSAYLIDNYPVPSTTQLDLVGGTTNYNFTINGDPLSSTANRFKIVYRQVDPAPVPVTFVSISANKVGNAVKVDWKVAGERNIKTYEIERSADSRGGFAKIAGATATGNSGNDVSYSFTDAEPLSGSNFYRIKSVGIGGEIKYTNIAQVLVNAKSAFVIAPNPVEGSVVNLQFRSKLQGRYSLRLMSNSGQTVFTKVVEHAGGNSTQIINLPESIARGAYQLEIISPDKTKEAQTLFINTLK